MKPRSLTLLLLLVIASVATLYRFARLSPELPAPAPNAQDPVEARPITPDAPKDAAQPPTTNSSIPPTISAPAPKRQGRTFYGSLPDGVASLAELPMANTPTKDWLPTVKQRLRTQAGATLKELNITPEESYIIRDGNGGRFVERVRVKVESKDGRYTSFFAEVDSESGHVLKTWGAAIPERPATHRH